MNILYVDDLRIPMFNNQNKIYIVRTYEGAITALQTKDIDIISLDHDLGQERTGYDIAKYIVENRVPLIGFKVHSANPVGVFNIRQLLTHYGYKEIK